MKQILDNIPGAVQSAIVILLFALVDWLVEDKTIAGIITGVITTIAAGAGVIMPVTDAPAMASRSVAPAQSKMRKFLLG